MGCYENPCSSCNTGCNPCNPCNIVNDSCCDLHLDYVPHTKCTISVQHNECSDTLDLCPAIKECETTTHLTFNNQTGCIEYENEKWLSTDGAEGSLEQVCVSEFYPFIHIPDLGDVDIDPDLDGNCYELIFHKDMSCGDECVSKHDHWVNHNHNYPGSLVQSFDYLRGENEDGCPVYLEKPDNCSILMHSPSCDAATGEVQWYQIPQAEEGDCMMEPDKDGYYHVVTLDDCGCPVECKLPVMPGGMSHLNYMRDSTPDDPDYPWYYGNYNEDIQLHLKENAPTFFGKYDLKVTVNYDVQAIKSDKMPDNYHWTSIVAPTIQGEEPKIDKNSSILKGFGIASTQGVQIPWGTASLRSSIVFIVPKGKEAYLHHEYRVRTNKSFPNYDTGAWDGQKVPDNEATLNSAKHPCSRLHSLQVLVEPTFGVTSYEATTDGIKDKLDAATDLLPQAFQS